MSKKKYCIKSGMELLQFLDWTLDKNTKGNYLERRYTDTHFVSYGITRERILSELRSHFESGFTLHIKRNCWLGNAGDDCLITLQNKAR